MSGSNDESDDGLGTMFHRRGQKAEVRHNAVVGDTVRSGIAIGGDQRVATAVTSSADMCFEGMDEDSDEELGYEIYRKSKTGKEREAAVAHKTIIARVNIQGRERDQTPCIGSSDIPTSGILRNSFHRLTAESPQAIGSMGAYESDVVDVVSSYNQQRTAETKISCVRDRGNAPQASVSDLGYSLIKREHVSEDLPVAVRGLAAVVDSGGKGCVEMRDGLAKGKGCVELRDGLAQRAILPETMLSGGEQPGSDNVATSADECIGNDTWFLGHDDYIPPMVHSFPKRDRCVCEQEWCRRVSVERFGALGQTAPLRIIANQSYREVLQLDLKFSQWRLFNVKIQINTHHYRIEDRHHAYNHRNNQFQANGEAVHPRTTESYVRTEIQLAAKIRHIDKKYYTACVEPHLRGRGDGTLTLQGLTDCYKNLAQELAISNNRLIAPGDQGCVEGPSVMCPEQIMAAARLDGSQLVKMTILAMTKDKPICIPNDIAREEYLYHYIHQTTAKTDTMSAKGPLVEATIPHSIASRRDSSRPPKKNSPHDIRLVMPTEPTKIMSSLIPMNEPLPRSSKRQYADYGFLNRGMVTLTIFSQGEVVRDYTMLECYDKKKEQKIYIDVQGSLPRLTSRKRSPWNHAHYYLVRDILSRDDVEKALKMVAPYNMAYLPVLILFLCRMKGKQAKEKKMDDELEDYISRLGEEIRFTNSVTEFETFFERLLGCFLRNTKRMTLSDLKRLTWAMRNIWNEDYEEMYNMMDRAIREQTRNARGKCTSPSARTNNKFLHYTTMLLHTQGMRDEEAFRLYTQLTTNLPDNESALQILRTYSFYDLYFLLTDRVFRKYGQGSVRAEAEIAKMLLVQTVFDDGFIPHDDSCTALYQFGKKKQYIVLNEMLRDNGSRPKCVATGHDRHVIKFAQHFNPYDGYSDMYVRAVCKVSKDWILWNLNEFVGQLQQCLKAKVGSNQEVFALHVLKELLDNYPEYRSIIMTLVREKQYLTMCTLGEVHQQEHS